MSSTGQLDPEVALYIQRLKTHFRVRTDEQLASKLGMSKQNLANWRRRGAVPARAAERIRREFNIALVEPPRRTRRAELSAAHALALMVVSDYLGSLAREPSLVEWRRLGDSYIFLVEANHNFIALEMPRMQEIDRLLPDLIKLRRDVSFAALQRMMTDDIELPPDFPA